MPAYLIANIDVKDSAAYEEYKAKVPAIVAKYGGEYLARGGRFVILEGDWAPTRMAVLRFPDIESVQALYASAEYEPLKTLRQRVTKTDFVVVEGV
jgi:uncharacterized protein (DUF1330 family)